jgi:hypothetical protein
MVMMKPVQLSIEAPVGTHIRDAPVSPDKVNCCAHCQEWLLDPCHTALLIGSAVHEECYDDGSAPVPSGVAVH